MNNKNDPWGDPRSYEPEGLVVRTRKNIWDNAHLLFGIIVLYLLALGVALCSMPVHASELGDFRGKHLSIFAALCQERGDADALLTHVEHGGTPEGVAYMQAADNTCTLTPMDVVVGDTLSEATDPQQVVWLLVSVVSLNGQSSAYMVSMKVLKTNVKSSDI